MKTTSLILMSTFISCVSISLVMAMRTKVTKETDHPRVTLITTKFTPSEDGIPRTLKVTLHLPPEKSTFDRGLSALEHEERGLVRYALITFPLVEFLLKKEKPMNECKNILERIPRHLIREDPLFLKNTVSTACYNALKDVCEKFAQIESEHKNFFERWTKKLS